jgi:hypothetical protein
MKLRWLLVLVMATALQVAPGQTSHVNGEGNVACAPFTQVEPLTPYSFARADLASLWHARNAVKDALAEMKQNNHAQASAFSTMTAMMRSTKVSTNDFICAKQLLEEYTSPKHLKAATASDAENIATAAKFAVMVYDEHSDINRRMLELLKKLSADSNTAELSDQISTLQVERGQRWADLVSPTTIAAMILVDARPTDDEGKFIKTTDPSVVRTKRLAITKKQKQELLDWANEHFTELKDGTPEDQWSDPTKTATLYMKVFAGRKCADE